MFVVAVAASVFFHQQFHISMTLGMRIKSALISALYRKVGVWCTCLHSVVNSNTITHISRHGDL